MDLLQKNKLLYARAGFGISLADYQTPRPIEEIVKELFPAAAPAELEIVTSEDWAKYSPNAMKALNNDLEKKEMQKEFRKRTKDINELWMQSMVYTSFPLLEKTALFWHGHFATRLDNPYYDQKILNIFRKNALGNFGDMLKDVSKSSAMLQFLNNQQNKKQHPNENFAREVMELFTLGRGHYTEDDVKEAARAFTGWGHDGNGDFIFRKGQHDDGEKKFLGKVGYFNGDDILDIILEQKQTAVFITQKLYRYFVSDEKIDDKRVKELAANFYSNHYDIGSLLKEIFTADWFYKDTTVGAKVKSPVELLVGYQRLVPLQFQDTKILINLQRVLGQYLFNAPNVAGWPGGKNWIDSSSLVIRMRLPEALFASQDLDLTAKEHDAESPAMMQHMENTAESPKAIQYKVGKAIPDWDNYVAYWKKTNRETLPASLANFLLTVPLTQQQIKDTNSFADHFDDADYIKSLTILLMEMPEFQLT